MLQVYFLSLAIDAEFAKVYRAVFAFRLGFIEEYILNADSNEDDDYSSAEEMEKELQRLEEEFLKELTQSQTEHAMRIIRGNGEYTTQENQSDEDEVSHCVCIKISGISIDLHLFSKSLISYCPWIISRRPPTKIMNC